MEEIKPPPHALADHEDAQFEEDLRRAMEESKAEAARSAPATSHASGSSTPASSSIQEPSSTPAARPGGSFLSERAQMERERLARQKRLRPDLAQDTRAAADTDEDEDEEEADDTRNPKRQRVSSSSAPPRVNVVSSSTRTSAPGAGTSKVVSEADTGEGLYFDGELRQTSANKHVDPAKDKMPVFRLTDILSPVRARGPRYPRGGSHSGAATRNRVRGSLGIRYQPTVVLQLLQSRNSCHRSYTGPARCASRSTILPSDHLNCLGHETIKEVLPNWIKTTPFLRNGWGCQHMKVRTHSVAK